MGRVRIVATDETPDKTPDKPGHLGHRQRLRERFMSGGAEALADYEMLEIVLFHAIPRQDTKPIAKALLKRFGSYAGVLHAEPGDVVVPHGGVVGDPGRERDPRRALSPVDPVVDDDAVGLGFHARDRHARDPRCARCDVMLECPRVLTRDARPRPASV